MASYKKGVGTTQLPTKNECSNQATATKKTYAKAMIVVKLGINKASPFGLAFLFEVIYEKKGSK